MSFDMAFWYEAQPPTQARMAEVYQILADSGGETGVVESNAAVDQFFADVISMFGDLTGEDADESPWMSQLHHTSECVITAISWSRSQEVRQALLELAKKNSLTAYDPQIEKGYWPRSVQSGAVVPELIAEPESGPSMHDHSEADLYAYLEDIEAGNGTFLVVARAAGPNDQRYAQVLRNEDGSYVVEYRDGDSRHHYGTTVFALQTAHTLLSGWAFDRPDWKAVHCGHGYILTDEIGR